MVTHLLYRYGVAYVYNNLRTVRGARVQLLRWLTRRSGRTDPIAPTRPTNTHRIGRD